MGERTREAARGGQPLSPAVRARLEPGFGHSFAGVRVHSGAVAERLTSQRSAAALAVGEDLFFGGGLYDPDSPVGLGLLAHELAHVVQQGGAGVETANSEVFEGAANRAAGEALAGAPVSAQPQTGGVAVQAFALSDLFDLRDQAPGDGLYGRPYAYGRVNEESGLDYGIGAGHAQGSHSGEGFNPGDRYTVGGGADLYTNGGHLGAWREGGESRYGWQHTGKLGSASGNFSYTGANGQGGTLGLEASGPSVDVGAWAGDGGFSLGAQGNLGSVSVSAGSTGTDRDEYGKFGLSAGEGAALRGYWGDSDNDGFREYGIGGDALFLGMDLKTEDPLRTGLASTIPFGGMMTDYLMPEGNLTESAANEFGLTTKNAGLDSTLEVLGGLLPDMPEMPDLPSLPSLPDFSLPDLSDMGVGLPLTAPLGGLLDTESWF